MSKSIKIDPFSRIEGHLAIRVEVAENRVKEAFCSGEMFRGFEIILKNRHPLDAQQITQRICGVCPIDHGIASVLAQDAAYQATPPENGVLVRNLIQGANYLMSHITHFYHLSALDFIDIAAIRKYTGSDPQLSYLKDWVEAQVASRSIYPAAPFLPRYEADYLKDTSINVVAIKHYLEALDIRALCHQMAAVFCGKIPHAPALVPGGVTERVTIDKIISYRSMLQKVQTFVETAYLPDVLTVAKAFPDYFSLGRGCGNFLAYGAFPEAAGRSTQLFPSGVVINGGLGTLDVSQITEDVMYSLFASPSGLPPTRGETIPDPNKTKAYSWLKAPRYRRQVMEVGPLARMMVAYLKGEPLFKDQLDAVLAKLGKKPADLISVMGRHAARALEAKIIAAQCFVWLERLAPGKPAFADFEIPGAGQGMGLTEAARGALGHWLEIKNGRIANYQCVVPTTWNCSPRDDQGLPGPVETALVGTPVTDDKNPIEVARVVRSFDPCIACAVH